MSRSRRVVARRVALAFLAVLLATSFLSQSRAGAVSQTASGYWFAAQTAGGQVPKPPNVPPNGMWVSSNTAGPVAISALRLTLDDAEAPPVIISLKINSEGPPGGASIFACPTTSAWQ